MAEGQQAVFEDAGSSSLDGFLWLKATAITITYEGPHKQPSHSLRLHFQSTVAEDLNPPLNLARTIPQSLYLPVILSQEPQILISSFLELSV